VGFFVPKGGLAAAGFAGAAVVAADPFAAAAPFATEAAGEAGFAFAAGALASTVAGGLAAAV
jgi:hypothetical protein